MVTFFSYYNVGFTLYDTTGRCRNTLYESASPPKKESIVWFPSHFGFHVLETYARARPGSRFCHDTEAAKWIKYDVTIQFKTPHCIIGSLLRITCLSWRQNSPHWTARSRFSEPLVGPWPDSLPPVRTVGGFLALSNWIHLNLRSSFSFFMPDISTFSSSTIVLKSFVVSAIALLSIVSMTEEYFVWKSSADMFLEGLTPRSFGV